MMLNLFKSIAFMLVFNIVLIIIRIYITQSLFGVFLIWNLFLAVIPLAIAYALSLVKAWQAIHYFYLSLWLLFLPNAPYLITDLIHLIPRQGIPYWYDTFMLFLSATNGLFIGIIAIKLVISAIKQHFALAPIVILEWIVCLLCGFGVYLGRYLRFNSWSMLTCPQGVLAKVWHCIIHPVLNSMAWYITMLFAAIIYVFYTTTARLVVSK
jgi:uncharacterized membrane protein